MLESLFHRGILYKAKSCMSVVWPSLTVD
uniref:Uncharacterized protein n=1 Tax=Arundo donax TaxID=35708 RepID=A0A0A8ZF36_ARUDO